MKQHHFPEAQFSLNIHLFLLIPELQWPFLEAAQIQWRCLHPQCTVNQDVSEWAQRAPERSQKSTFAQVIPGLALPVECLHAWAGVELGPRHKIRMWVNPGSSSLGKHRGISQHSPCKRELGWVQLHVYIAQGLGSSFPVDVQTHEKLYLTFPKRWFNLRTNRTLTGGEAPGSGALVFQDTLQTFRRNYRQESFNVFCKSGLCPVSRNWKPPAVPSPTMAVEMHKHHELWSRSWESPG